MFTGAMVALITPFQDGEIDLRTLDELVDFQLENGIDAIVPVGTTGECPTLSHTEHKKVIERVVKAAGGKVPVIAGAGSNSTAEAIELTAIHSVAGLVDPHQGIVSMRPFRAPHHSVSEAGLVGGGELPRPGELSLAHHGVLFLDEIAEFRRITLEALRQPLEDGQVCIARVRARASFPARPLVVAAVNPCPCGYFGDPVKECTCSLSMVSRYQKRISGPLLDRVDIPIEVSLPDTFLSG